MRKVDREFVEFVAERSSALMRIAYTLTGDQRAAEDLLQGALAKAYTRWSQINGDAEAYVRRILYNDRVSWWRRLGRHREVPMAEVPEQPEIRQHDHDTSLRLMLREVLLELPPRQRAVLVLRYLEDRTVIETAQLLGCDPGTVASQCSRALAKLRSVVAERETRTAATETLR